MDNIDYEKKKGNKLIIILFIILFLLAIAAILYFMFIIPNNNKSNKTTTKTEPITTSITSTTTTRSLTLSEKQAIAKILELAKNPDLKIITKLETKILVSYIGSNNSSVENNWENEYGVYIELKEGKIYLTNKNYSSEITDINEKIIFMVTINTSGAGYGHDTYGFLTENKNVYALEPEMLNPEVLENRTSSVSISDQVKNKLLKNESQKLGLKRINGNYKVEAFTEYAGMNLTTPYSVQTVYTDDNNIRLIDDMNYIHPRYISFCGTRHFLKIYKDKKLSISDDEKLQNSLKEDLIYKKIFNFGSITSGIKTYYIIIDENNYIYVETQKNYNSSSSEGVENKVDLYSLTAKYVSHSISKEGKKLTIKLSDGKQLVIEDEYTIELFK